MENRVYLEQWLVDAVALAKKIHSCAQERGGMSAFTIATTVKAVDRTRPYLTPLRYLRDGAIGGALAFSQLQARLLCREVDGLVDWIWLMPRKRSR